MVDKNKKLVPDEDEIAVQPVPVVDTTTENKAPERVYSSFDDFFHEYALANSVNLKWKESIKKHLKAIDCLKDQSKWLDGIKNFGL